MSNRDPDLGYRDLGQWGRFLCDSVLRKAYTALPGIVTGYDPNLRRARVIPALDMLFTDGTSMCHPVIVDVPVLWPGTNRWQMTFPLEDGDGVLLVFSARDISGFKEAGELLTRPASDRIMFLSDAVAIPGFGNSEFVPVASDAVAVQSADGATSSRDAGRTHHA